MASNFTFPQHNDFPAVGLKRLNMLLIALLCSLYLRFPICFIGLTGMRIMTAAIMPMPIASMNEDSNFLSGEYNIRFSGQRLVIHTVAVSHRKQLAAHQKFNTGIFAFDVRHDLTTADRGNRIAITQTNPVGDRKYPSAVCPAPRFPAFPPHPQNPPL